MKDQYIKIRISGKDKKKLIQSAEREKKTLSSYLLERGLGETDAADRLPVWEKVEMTDNLNEICHRLQRCGDAELCRDIRELCRDTGERLWRTGR